MGPGGGAASTGISPRKSTLDKEQVKPGGSHGPQRPEAGIYPTALARQHPMTFAGVESQTPPLPVAPPVLGKGSTMQIQHLTPVVSKACCCCCLVSCVRHFVTPRIVACQVLCPWNFPGKNTGVGSHSLLQGIFPTKGLKPGLLHCRWILYHLSHQGNPAYLEGSRQRQADHACFRLNPSEGNKQLICKVIHLPSIQQMTGHPKLPRQHQLINQYKPVHMWAQAPVPCITVHKSSL